jgi:transcriptional regulator with XRE-family HTH domain
MAKRTEPIPRDDRESGFNGTVSPEDQRKRARELREVEGKQFSEIADTLGLIEGTVREWAKRENWSSPRIIKHILSERVVVKRNTPTLEAALSSLYSRTKVEKEQAFDEHLHDIACAVPYIVKQMPVDEWITKADKISKLVTMAREILGRTGEQKASRPLVSIGVLSASVGHPKVTSAEVIELQQLADAESTG